jgi:ligand-binding sensor domain-containing protein/signal transduction histidine kinase
MLISKENWAKSYLLWLMMNIIYFTSFGNVLGLQYTNPIIDREFNSKTILSIAQDSTGFIWIGTNDGLFRYDGNKLTSYKSDPTDSTSLPANGIKKLFTDSSGTLWLATNFGLCKYNRCFDNFERISTASVLSDSVYLNLSSITQDNEKSIYFSGNGTIYKFQSDLKTVTLFLELDSVTISDFVFDENNNLWISTLENGGLFFYNPKENKTERFLHDENNRNSLSNNSIRDIVYEGDSKLWIGTYGGGVNLLDTKNRTFKRYTSADYYSNYIVSIYIDQQNNLWICDLNTVKWYDRTTDRFIKYENFQTSENNSKQNPAEIMQDQQGNYWTIYQPGGVGFSFKSQGINFYNDNPSNFFHTINNNTSVVAFDKNGNLWIGSGNDGIDIFDWKNKKQRIYHSDQNNPYSIGEGAVYCIYKDYQDKMWIGTNLGGLQYYDEDNDRFITYVNDPRNPNSISNNDIRGIVEDKVGNFWVVAHGKGVDYFNTSEQKFYNYSSENSNLSNNWTFQVYIDSNENLWVATAHGVSKLKKGNKTFQSYHNDENDINTINNPFVNCIFEDSKKRVWIGTLNGLCRYNPDTDNFTRFRPEFASQNITSIKEGNNGNLWISTLTGISEFNPETGEIIHNLYELDNLPDCILSNRGSAINDVGILFFASRVGVIYFNPDDLHYNNSIPDVYLTGFYLNNQKITKFGGNEIMAANINCIKDIELKHNQNSVGFEFASTNYIYAERNRFKYKLEGIDADWIETTDGKVTYNYLPPGDYIFRVITANNSNVWNLTGSSISITINKPWWLSWWFISVAIVFLLFCTYLVFKYRMAALEDEKNKLEEMVQIRTQKLNENNILLKQQKEQIEQQANNLTEINKELYLSNSTKDKLFSIIAHDLINPFNAILGFSSELIDNYDLCDENQKIQFLNYINDSSKKAFNLMQNLLHWARSQKDKIEFNPEYLKVSEVFGLVAKEVLYLALKKDVQIVSHLKDEDLMVFFDSDMIKLILRNLLMNAIKFSNPQSEIFINAEKIEQNSILFSVKDKGVGMKAEYASSIFNPAGNISISEGTSGEKGVGLGLELCKEFVTSQKGNIWVESSPGEGSTFFFTIPNLTIQTL